MLLKCLQSFAHGSQRALLSELPLHLDTLKLKSCVLPQGNSNNIATIDISVGFVGLESYIEAPAVFLTSLSTYAGPLLWACHLICHLSSEGER